MALSDANDGNYVVKSMKGGRDARSADGRRPERDPMTCRKAPRVRLILTRVGIGNGNFSCKRGGKIHGAPHMSTERGESS